MLELMIATYAIRNQIRENRTHQLPQQIEAGAGRGMRTFDADLLRLLLQGYISRETALSVCRDPRTFLEELQSAKQH